jgi:ubiquinone/menaquinone biosynthesis C-methylase UbiE
MTAHRVPSLLACLLLALGCGSLKRFAYEGVGRDGWQQPDRVVAALGIEPGARVADVGAGGGYFTFRLARAVGPTGKVYAVDVDEDMTNHLRQRAAAEGFDNVVVILGEYGDPLLPDGEIDLVFTCNTYHHIEDRTGYFEGVRRDLAPGGRVAVIELNDHSWFPRTFGHFTPKPKILEELGAAGYRLERDHEFLERQHFVVFAAPSG